MKELTTLIKSSIMDVWQGPKYIPECPSAELFKNLAINTKMLGQIVPRLMLIRIIMLDQTTFMQCFSLLYPKKIKKTNLQLFMQYQLLTVKALQEQFEDKLVKKNLNQFLFIILGLKISNQPRLKTQFGNFKETSTNRYNLG